MLRSNANNQEKSNHGISGSLVFSSEADSDDNNNNNGAQSFEIKDIHLAFGDTTETYVFSFTTTDKIEAPGVKISKSVDKDFFIPNVAASPPVKNDGNNEMEILAQNEFYTFPPTYTSLYFHHVKVSNFKPGTQYFYQVGDHPSNKKKEKWSQVYSFKTLPSRKSDDNPVAVNLAIVGDLGQTKVSKKTLDLIRQRKNRINGIIIAGDLSYADCDQSRWQTWFDLIQHEHISSTFPIMVAPGNHEVEGRHMCGNDDVKEEFVAYRRRFYMPTAQFAQFRNTYYSFEVSRLAHFIILCPYCPYDAESTQYKWFEEDVRKIDRTQTPWLFVVTHEPFYCSNKAHYKEAEDMRKIYEPLFNRYHVNMVFSGHVHSYERTHAIYNGQVVAAHKASSTGTPVEEQKRKQDGTVYITVGDGGNREGLAIGFFDEKPEWSARRERKYGFGELEMTPTRATWTWTFDADPAYHDKVVLVKK